MKNEKKEKINERNKGKKGETQRKIYFFITLLHYNV